MNVDDQSIPALESALLAANRRTLTNPSDDASSDEVARVAQTLLTRGDEGVAVFRRLVKSPDLPERFLGACWLIQVDGPAAVPVLQEIRKANAFPQSAMTIVVLDCAKAQGFI